MVEAQRKAKNEAVFREVNERIESVAAEFGIAGEASFFCECGQAACTEMLSMTLREYREIRSEGRRFVIVPGHEDPAFERVVFSNHRFAVVEKNASDGLVAEAPDVANPRP
jgi:Icc-related predicted phosphoesterase